MVPITGGFPAAVLTIVENSEGWEERAQKTAVIVYQIAMAQITTEEA